MWRFHEITKGDRQLPSGHIPHDREIENTLEQCETRVTCRDATDTADTPIFIVVEMIVAIKSFKNKKALDLDLIEIVVLKAACRLIQSII